MNCGEVEEPALGALGNAVPAPDPPQPSHPPQAHLCQRSQETRWVNE